MSIHNTIEILHALFIQDERNYTLTAGSDGDYCPGFSDGNPKGLPCDCPHARAYLLGLGRAQCLCYLGICPVRTVLNAYM